MDSLKGLVTPLVKQTWVVSAILFQMLGHGMNIGITSSMVPALLSPDSPFKVDLEQASRISAMIGPGVILTCIVSIYSSATYGRRLTIMGGLIPGIVGPLLCYFTPNVNVFIFGRFLSGISFGIGIMTVMVIGEFTSPEYRGVFLNLKLGIFYFGFMVVHILCNYFHWGTVLLTTSIPYILNFAMAFTWPESPAWLVSKHRYDECTRSFYWLRGKSEQSTRELCAMISVNKEQVLETDSSLFNAIKIYLKKFKKKNFLKPMGVYLFIAILVEFTGRHVFPAYALQIVYEVDPDRSKAFYYTLCIDLLMMFSAIMSTVFIKIMKRRTLLFSSGVSSVFILLFVCLYYFLQSKSVISTNRDIVPLILFGSYFVVVNMGCTPICFTLMGEIFPLEHRPTATACSGILLAMAMMVTLKIAPVLLESIKLYGTFSVFSITMCVCLIILYFILPETKDKTLQEIESHFCDIKILKCEDEKHEVEGMLTDVDDAVKWVPGVHASQKS